MFERCLSFRVRRFLWLVLVVMLAFGPISRAYADDFEGGDGGSHNIGGSYPNFGTVWYGPELYNGNDHNLHYLYGVVANTKYDAAMYCCMGGNFDWEELSNKKKVELLAESDFTDFADLFYVGRPSMKDEGGNPDAAGSWYSIIAAWLSARAMYGETYCWSVAYTFSQKYDATNCIKRILNGDDSSSGSGGSGNTGGGSSSDVKPEYELNDLYGKICDGNDWANDPYHNVYGTLGVRLTDVNGFTSAINSKGIKRFYFIYQPIQYKSGNTGVYGDRFYLVGSPTDIEFDVKTDNDETEYYNVDMTSDSKIYMAQTSYNRVIVNTSNGVVSGTLDFGVPNFTDKGTSLSISGKLEGRTSTEWYYTTFLVTNIKYGASGGEGGGEGGGGGDDEPVDPPVTWPDPPSKPVGGGPDVPTPGDPVTPTPPDPVEPTPGNPWIPIPNDDITITGDDFQDLLDALNEHCIHLQDSIESNVSQLWGLQSEFFENQFSDLFDTLNDNFSWLGTDVIVASFTDLKDYLHQLFEWLADQMEFNVDVTNGQYDDTSLLYWLKQIWAKLPTGINTRPSDPVTNSTGWWDWLTQLLNNLAADLMALGHESLAGVLETLNELRNKFPFSLPWDVAALLGLLVGPAVCPEFDVPCYTITAGMQLQQVGTYHVTLEPYETVWQGVKWIETLAFAVYLIMNTGGLMDMVQRTVRPR